MSNPVAQLTDNECQCVNVPVRLVCMWVYYVCVHEPPRASV